MKNVLKKAEFIVCSEEDGVCWCCAISAGCFQKQEVNSSEFFHRSSVFPKGHPFPPSFLCVWVSESRCPFSQTSRCASSCVLALSCPPVRPCWMSLYHPLTMPSHHAGSGKKRLKCRLHKHPRWHEGERGMKHKVVLISEIIQMLSSATRILWNAARQ